MRIKKFTKDIRLPERQHETDAGLDCYLPESFTIKPFETICIGLGFGIEVPQGYATMFIPRSSTAIKGLICQTSVVDCSYQGEVHLILTNCSTNTYTFNKNERVVSMITYKYLDSPLEEISDFSIKTKRGKKGLGSTGQ